MVELIFSLPAFIFLVSGLPQTFKMIKRKSACDLSLTTYSLTALAIAIICINAAVEQVWTIVLSNGVSLIMVLINLFLIFKYQKHAKNSRIGNA